LCKFDGIAESKTQPLYLLFEAQVDIDEPKRWLYGAVCHALSRHQDTATDRLEEICKKI